MVNQVSPQLQNHIYQVNQVLQRYLHKDVRIRLFLGNPETGEQWLEEYDIQGYVGKSCGSQPIFILLNNRRSDGGPAISVSSVIRITVDKRNVFQVSNYRKPQLAIQPCDIKANGFHYTHGVYHKKLNGTVENVANFTSEDKAKYYIEFQHGIRNKI